MNPLRVQVHLEDGSWSDDERSWLDTISCNDNAYAIVMNPLGEVKEHMLNRIRVRTLAAAEAQESKGFSLIITEREFEAGGGSRLIGGSGGLGQTQLHDHRITGLLDPAPDFDQMRVSHVIQSLEGSDVSLAGNERHEDFCLVRDQSVETVGTCNCKVRNPNRDGRKV